MDLVKPSPRNPSQQCEKIIRPYIRRTPVIEVDGQRVRPSAGALTLKLELLQHSGSFKARGAFTNLLTRDVPEAGVVAASGGNHGAAVAYAAMRLGKPAKIFVPSVSSPAKVARIRDYGADLTIEGDGYADALAASRSMGASGPARCRCRRSTRTKPSWDKARSAWSSTQQLPDIDTVLVAVGGGGLIAGIAAWYAGRVKVDRRRTVCVADADQGVGGRTSGRCGGRRAGGGFAGAARVGERVFPIVQKYAPQTVLVSDEAIAERASRRCGAPCASWRSREAPPRSRRCCREPISQQPASAWPSSSAAATRRR